MVVGTYRDREATGSRPLTQTLGSLVRETNFHRLALAGLSREEFGEFVEASAGITVSESAVGSLHQRTEGNPLFVGEVVRSVSPEEMGRNQDWVEDRSEEHTSELQSRTNLVCRLLLEKKKIK